MALKMYSEGLEGFLLDFCITCQIAGPLRDWEEEEADFANKHRPWKVSF